MGRRSSRGRLGARVDAAFDTVGLTILPGVDMPEWAQALMVEPPPAPARPIVDQQQVPEQATGRRPAGESPARQWAASPQPWAQSAQAEADQPAGDVAALVGAPGGPGTQLTQPGGHDGQLAMSAPGVRAGSLAPGPHPAPDAQARTLAPTPPGAAPSAPPTAPAAPAAPGATPATIPSIGYGDQPAQSWASPQTAGEGPGLGGEHHEFSDEQVALLSWWADTIAAGTVPPTPAPEPPPAKQRRTVSRWAVITVLLALAALAAALVAGPRIWDEPASTPAATTADVTLPDEVAGLVRITDAQIAEGMRPLINLGMRPAGVMVTRAYGPAETGPVSLAAMGTTTPASGDAASQIEAWAQRTGSDVDEPVTGSRASADVVCAAAVGTKAVPSGAFCVWTGDGVRGQTYAVERSAKKALRLTADVRAGTAF